MVCQTLLVLMSTTFLMLRLGSGGSFPRQLSKEEEARCVDAWVNGGDLAARNTLIEHNLRLVAHVIKKYYTSAEEQEDLISIGTIGLIKGINTYRPDKGVRLATYASKCVENAILSQRNKLNLAAKTSHHVAKNGAYSVTYADTGRSCYATYHTK